MKLKISLISMAIFLLTSSCVKKKHEETALEQDNLKGQVKSVVTKIYKGEESGDVWEKGNLVNGTYTKKEYNPEGEVIEASEYFKSGKIKYATSYLYNSLWNEKSQVKNFKSVKQYNWLLGEALATTNFKYDDNQMIQEYVQQNANGSFISKTSYFYNGTGELQEMVEYNTDGTTGKTTKYYYDKKHNVVKESVIASNTSLSGHHEYTYDKRGNLIMQADYDLKESLIGINEIGKDGEVVKKMYPNKDSSFDTLYISYNDQGLMDSTYGRSKNGSTFRVALYSYRFDSKNNYVESTKTLYAPFETTITERTIEYWTKVDADSFQKTNHKDFVYRYTVGMRKEYACTVEGAKSNFNSWKETFHPSWSPTNLVVTPFGDCVFRIQFDASDPNMSRYGMNERERYIYELSFKEDFTKVSVISIQNRMY
jgi:YD repeat-containing protein